MLGDDADAHAGAVPRKEACSCNPMDCLVARGEVLPRRAVLLPPCISSSPRLLIHLPIRFPLALFFGDQLEGGGGEGSFGCSVISWCHPKLTLCQGWEWYQSLADERDRFMADGGWWACHGLQLG